MNQEKRWNHLRSLLWVPEAIRAALIEQEEFSRACLSLQALISPHGVSVAHFSTMITELAATTTHSALSMPGHLTSLLLNRWAAQALPKAWEIGRVLIFLEEHPVECEQQCLSRFLTLLEWAKEQTGA